jgi:hypothetical protein
MNASKFLITTAVTLAAVGAIGFVSAQSPSGTNPSGAGSTQQNQATPPNRADPSVQNQEQRSGSTSGTSTGSSGSMNERSTGSTDSGSPGNMKDRSTGGRASGTDTSIERSPRADRN